ncbi:hypothetical protein AAVH_04692 [Aphelenchoides avenae]|nr:hypothetical protein AAVH_38746 [Aphelenchus avenae]KAH7727648.1 hypothetical protein AAVH_04692 [Aphelenchus avenae]
MTLCDSIEAPCKFLFAKEKPEWLQKCCGIHACFLVDACLPMLLEDAEKIANDSHRIQSEFRLDADQEERLVSFALRHIDYTVDVIGYLCSGILSETVRLRSLVTQDPSDFHRWITPVAHDLVQNRAMSKSRCKALLQILRECHPLDVLSEEFFQRMYAEIGNPSLSVQISQLITEDMCLFPSRRPSHIASLKQALVAESLYIRRAIYQRLLPSIFKNAQLLTFVVENFEELCDLPESDQSLEAVLTLTKFAVQHQKSHSKQLAWNDLIKEERLVKGILHASDEV